MVADMPNYRRAWVPGGTYFFTVNLLERDRRLLVDHVDDLRDAFRKARVARPFDVLAAVVLPDHLHCLWRLPPGDADNATRWRHIKSAFSRALPPGERRSRRRVVKAERSIWQLATGSIWSAMNATSRRAWINPVKHGYVTRVADWPYSTFHR
jgi:putative transposase